MMVYRSLNGPKKILFILIFILLLILILINLVGYGNVPELNEVNPNLNHSNQSFTKPIDGYILIAANDSSAAAKSAAQYICQGFDDEKVIQTALNTQPSGSSVLLMAGMYNCSGEIIPLSNTTLQGEGSLNTILKFTNNGRIRVDYENVSLKDFQVSGTGYTKSWEGVITIRASHALLHNIVGYADATTQAVFMIFSEGEHIGYNKEIEDVEFNSCSVKNAETFAFLNSAASDTAYNTIHNIRYIDCEAINCGRYDRYDDWVAGFDLAEQVNIDTMEVIRCRAEGNWESGFHFEGTPTKRNVLIRDCISSNNAQKRTTGTEPMFGAGYLVDHDIRLENCSSENNLFGFRWSVGGGSMVGCSDRGSMYGFYGRDLVTFTSCTAVDELYPVFFWGDGKAFAPVIIDNISVSATTTRRSGAAVRISDTVPNPESILVVNSTLQDYQIGIYNYKGDVGRTKVQNVIVTGATTNFINCDILSKFF
jgi:hypothetical protein